jgi:anthranilate/para-aminobenzoate synthase component II
MLSFDLAMWRVFAICRPDDCPGAAVAPTVFYNDQICIEDLLEIIRTEAYDNIVISPGPGTPERRADVGRTHERSPRSMPF